MTTMNANVETTDVRALTEAEIGDVAGGASFLRYMAALVKAALATPDGCTLVYVSDDGTATGYQCEGER
jgi:hypothetical protein